MALKVTPFSVGGKDTVISVAKTRSKPYPGSWKLAILYHLLIHCLLQKIGRYPLLQ